MTRARSLAVCVAALSLSLAACGGSGESVSSGGAVADAPPAAGACLAGAEDCQDTGALPPDQGGGADGDPGQATQVEPTDGLDDLRAVGWETIEVDPDDQSRVTVYWWSGVEPCNALSSVDAEFTDDAVTLTVMEGTVPADEPQACIEIAQYKSATVELAEEIGPRSILDGGDA